MLRFRHGNLDDDDELDAAGPAAVISGGGSAMFPVASTETSGGPIAAAAVLSGLFCVSAKWHQFWGICLCYAAALIVPLEEELRTTRILLESGARRGSLQGGGQEILLLCMVFHMAFLKCCFINS